MDQGIIKKLDELVVNKIAAGEVIQRPANALKEMVENSLDAKSTDIRITVKAGGLKYMQIQDNGTGIRKQDLEIVCERFTTSKLTDFEDLKGITTFGFRGEALSSISHVAHLTIQTKTAGEVCGFKAAYENGKLKLAPKACACNQGTTITIEDLFYNMPQRKQSVKSPSEEFQRILDVVTKYAVHNCHVSFMLKKFGEQPSVKTSANCTREQNIRALFGAEIAKELMPMHLDDSQLQFKMSAFITKVKYFSKKGALLLFINNRLVESAALKAAIDKVYSIYLPKGTHPFIYICLEMNSCNLDVNVHPTKHEVMFFHEVEIIEKIKSAIEQELLASATTRSIYKQLKLPGISESSSIAENSDKCDKVYAKDMVRTDAKEQKLEKFFLSEQSLEHQQESTKPNDKNASMALLKPRQVRLTSVLNMQASIEKNCSVFVRKIVNEMVFVGILSDKYVLMQHETKLFLTNVNKLCEELFYQRLIFQFQNMQQIQFVPKLPIKDLLLIALNSKMSGWTEEDGDKEQLAQDAKTILMKKSPIMQEYFNLKISEDGFLESMPCIVPKHCPSKVFLPQYLLTLAVDVAWESEEECFETFCRETAHYYASVSLAELQTKSENHRWTVEHVLIPTLKKFFLPPYRMKKYFSELTNLPKLYKVFERC